MIKVMFVCYGKIWNGRQNHRNIEIFGDNPREIDEFTTDLPQMKSKNCDIDNQTNITSIKKILLCVGFF